MGTVFNIGDRVGILQYIENHKILLHDGGYGVITDRVKYQIMDLIVPFPPRFDYSYDVEMTHDQYGNRLKKPIHIITNKRYLRRLDKRDQLQP